MISFSLWLRRFNFSRLPLASIGRSNPITIGVVIFASGIVLKSGSTYSVSDRQMSSAQAGGDRVFLEFESGGGDVLEGVFRFCAFGFIQRGAMHLWIDALREQLACIDCHLSCERQ